MTALRFQTWERSQTSPGLLRDGEVGWRGMGWQGKQLWDGYGRPFFDIVQVAFSLLTTTSTILQGALKDGLGDAVVARNMPEPCEFQDKTRQDNLIDLINEAFRLLALPKEVPMGRQVN